MQRVLAPDATIMRRRELEDRLNQAKDFLRVRPQPGFALGIVKAVQNKMREMRDVRGRRAPTDWKSNVNLPAMAKSEATSTLCGFVQYCSLATQPSLLHI